MARLAPVLTTLRASRRRAGLDWRHAALLAMLCWGCQPVIGDKCTLSTDCSTRGDRQCDTSQPGGYCTIPNCRGNTCPDRASCVLYRGSVPGCGYDDRALARTGRSFCTALCETNAECRAGYECRDPRAGPWHGVILDDVQEVKTCVVTPLAAEPDTAPGEPNVCRVASPETPSVEAGAGKIEPWDAGVDAAADAPADAPDAG